MAVSIIIADDFPAIRHGARSWLEEHSDLKIIGEANDSMESVRLVARHAPNVLITGLPMPSLSGLAAPHSTHQLAPRTHVVVWSHRVEEEYLVEAFRRGASAYLLKTSPAEVLVRAVRAAAKGNYFLDPAFAGQSLESYLKKAQQERSDPLQDLTPREREILPLVTAGSSSAEIAHRLHISPRTVEQHRARMMRKLRLHNQTELVRFALRRGIISWEE